MYCAYITKLKKIRNHPNADRLLLAECFGNTVVVDLNSTEDKLGIYFPVDGKLGVEFCKKNNLCRKKDENGNNIGGFLDPDKRNIQAIKLRGEKSDGLWLPIESLSGFCDIKMLKEGDTITILNGITICEKYIPIRKNQSFVSTKNNSNKKKTKIDIAPLFAEHADTEQLAYNLSAFHEGDLIEITLKMHGCFVSGTKVRMADHSLKEIQNIKVGDNVLGYNFNTKRFESTKVKNVFHNAPSNKWNKIKFSRNHISGDKRGSVICTYNHPFWYNEYNCWIDAEDLEPNMTISTLSPSYILTNMQKEILTGMILGNGYFRNYDNISGKVEFSQSKRYENYINYIIEISNGLMKKDKITYKSRYDSDIIRVKSKTSIDLYNYMNSILNISKDVTKLKDEIINSFTLLSLAIFYMDDGNLCHDNKQKDSALFAVCDYNSKSDCEIICKCFEKFGITPILYTDTEGYNRIRLNTAEAYKMFDLIYKYIPKSMRYKLPLEYWNKEFILPIDDENFEYGYAFSKQTVLENKEINKEYEEFDLETDLHNYVVGLSLVHNTSQRTGYLPKFKKYKKTLKDILLRKDGIPIYEYGYITGTRRTVLKDFGEGGYYGSDSFREPHAKAFEGKLYKGETVYYEVVGFTDNGTPIMGSVPNKRTNDKKFIKQYGDTTTFSYGCSPDGNKKSDFYVYRMTITNEDGDVIEYTPDYMRYRCEQMGVKTVPVFWKGYLNEPDDWGRSEWSAGDYAKLIAENDYDGADPIGKTHIREGVVVRIVNRPTFKAYKHKNFYFKVLEGLAKADATEPDIEEAQEVINNTL